ncbi:type II toxin-antitoxin system VapC family toxin [methane-oxidizing endosymbiont of Gigantopelta aegis]|uniref:type II toxin-antitoxin system VapC family toxin n=1 Tax=methane-oxidizing endosymbiont of Gigantopelta aegis TaxID=2794938 RepID=UPI0018DEB0DD|nr:type II toxin-antitoxin system VapC family toxin [methane-oxidizing endosymbiont of Gigantopelta aegis]
MNDKQFLVESNIFIYHINNEPVATQFLTEYFCQCCISQLSFIEVLSFDFTHEERQAVQELLEGFEIIDTTKDISLQAISNRDRKKIKIADNIIASTAQVYSLTLVTRSIKDFQSLDIKLLNPFGQ